MLKDGKLDARLRGRHHPRHLHHPRRAGRHAATRTAGRGAAGVPATSGARRDRMPPRRSDDLRARDLRRLRGHLQGAGVLHTPLMSGTNAIHGIVARRARMLVSWAAPTRRCTRIVGLRRRGRSARSTWSAASWSPTACSRCSGRSRGQAASDDATNPALAKRDPRGLPGGRGPLHPRPQGLSSPKTARSRQPARGGRHGARGRRHAPRPRRSSTTQWILVGIVVGRRDRHGRRANA